jgi:hypothetical protein
LLLRIYYLKGQQNIKHAKIIAICGVRGISILAIVSGGNSKRNKLKKFETPGQLAAGLWHIRV